MPTVFVSYRRGATAGVVHRLAERLREAFGAGNVFLDVDSLPPGEDFRGRRRGCRGPADPPEGRSPRTSGLDLRRRKPGRGEHRQQQHDGDPSAGQGDAEGGQGTGRVAEGRGAEGRGTAEEEGGGR